MQDWIAFIRHLQFIFCRQATTALASGVVVTSTMDTSSGLTVNLYVQGSTGLIPQVDVVAALWVRTYSTVVK